MTILTPRHKIVAYVLNKEFYYSQNSIACLMGVCQNTISNAVKEAGYWLLINKYKRMYFEAREELNNMGYIAPPSKPQLPMRYFEANRIDEE